MSTAEAAADQPLAARLAESIRRERETLTRRWLDRIAARVQVDPNRIFPTEALLDHVPVLMDGVASYIENPAHEISAEVAVMDKAMELGRLRHAQGFDAYEILKEYEILGGILFAHLGDETAAGAARCDAGELLACAQRLSRAVSIIETTTLGEFLDETAECVQEREGRLRAFNRALSHELKNRIGAILGAADVLTALPDLDHAQRSRFAEIVGRNARDMEHTLANLLDLTRIEDGRQQRHVELPEAVKEVMRRLRDAAAARDVQVCVDGELPQIEVKAAAVELALTNYISNAIKYSDPATSGRRVDVSAAVERDGNGCELVVRVRDNGLGVPEPARDSLFQRFFRAHEEAAAAVEGTGLGLSIVRETVEAIGGRAWAEFPGRGSVFAFAIPCRREADASS